MDNQHRLISGYRDLTEEEIALMNEAKQLGENIGDFIERLSKTHDVDGRWVAIGRTDMQKGLMSLIRGIARPETF